MSDIALVQGAPWELNWLWGIPLIIVTVVIHVLGLGLVHRWVVPIFGRRQFSLVRLVLVMGSLAWLAVVLLAIEALLWGLAYRALGALPDGQSAMLYSLGALTSYGHEPFFLEKRWQLMGALEALNGIMLFGLTTAFMFAILQRIWPTERL